MNKKKIKIIKLEKGVITYYGEEGLALLAYKTNYFIDDEVFLIVKDGKGVVIEQPCFYDNIKELEEFIINNNIDLVGKLISYHGAGGSFMKGVPTYGTKSSIAYNLSGGGAALVNKFTRAFGPIFDSSIETDVKELKDGEVILGGITFIVTSNHDAYDIEIPELNSIYTHMLGHDCHSIVAGPQHADGIINQLNSYIAKGYDFVLTSHYVPEDLKDVKTKIEYLKETKAIAATCQNAEEMEAKMLQHFPEYSGKNYLEMTVHFFFEK